MIPYGRQTITQQDIDAVVDVLKSDWLTQGPTVQVFESGLATYCGVSHAVAMNSATSALHVACLALGLGEDDWLWTSPNTFVASANCGRYCGARVDFVDICPRTYNMSVPALEQKLHEAEQHGRLPKVVVPVHFAGQSCDMRAIRKLADQYGFHVIEDASHAVGGSYLGEAIGNCRYSDITIFSFHPVKIITTAEGGMALTNSPGLAERMHLLRSHAITRDESQMSNDSHGPWYYEQLALGYNYRMTDMQAALGVSQLQRLDEFVVRRRALAADYNAYLAEFPVTLPWQSPDTQSAWHLYAIRLNVEDEGETRHRVFNSLRAAGIGVNVHYIPVHLQPYYGDLGYTEGMFPEAERYYRQAISLPLFPAMTEAQFNTVISALGDALQ